jgi:hypothetical protein
VAFLSSRYRTGNLSHEGLQGQWERSESDLSRFEVLDFPWPSLGKKNSVSMNHLGEIDTGDRKVSECEEECRRSERPFF